MERASAPSDRQRATIACARLIRREDSVADRLSVAVEQKEAIAVAGEADGETIVDGATPDVASTLRAPSQTAAHIASGSRSRQPGAGCRGGIATAATAHSTPRWS